MTKFLKILIPSLFLMQIMVASCFELAHDEAYYWLFSKDLDWGYFDHPPFVAVVIRMFSFLPHTEFSVRIGFIVLQFLALLVIFRLLDKRHYNTATLLFFAFPLASFTGLLALPDIPLLFMTALYCWMLNLYLEKKELGTGILLAISIALLLYAKYHGILLVFFTIVALPGLLKERNFYIIALVSVLLFLPHAWWQYEHDFATLRYHFLERPRSDFSLKRIGEYLITQVALAGVLVGPVVWWTVIKYKTQTGFERAMKSVSIGVTLFFLVSTFSKKFEANWTIFLAVPLIYLSASSEVWNKRYFRGLLYASFMIVVLARLLFIFPSESTGIKRLKEFNGWSEWAQELKKKCEDPIVANSYQIASKLSYYLIEEVHALNYHSRKNQFDYWRFDQRRPIKKVCYVTDTQEFGGEELITPEGKKLVLVKNQDYAELLSKKDASMR